MPTLYAQPQFLYFIPRRAGASDSVHQNNARHGPVSNSRIRPARASFQITATPLHAATAGPRAILDSPWIGLIGSSRLSS